MSGKAEPDSNKEICIFLCGDVMTGRGIDQIMPHPCSPELHEDWVRSAKEYVHLAERASGKIPVNAAPAYIWGQALDALRLMRPDARIINLETSITRSQAYVRKGINYRMSPENAECLTAARIDCCALANNHVLDWERQGLLDTLDTLDRLRIKHAGAGRNMSEAGAPAILPVKGKGRVIVYSFASVTSGVPMSWKAAPFFPGVNLLPDLSNKTAAKIARQVISVRQPGDIAVVSIHWGPNWGYEIPEEQQDFAHTLIDEAQVSAVHGHSSHHPKAIEIYKGRPILYGCGDFLNDYEGISGYEEFRGDLVLMYFPAFDCENGLLTSFRLTPLQIRRFQLVTPSAEDTLWIQRTLDRESAPFGVRVSSEPDGPLALSWPQAVS
ncbi:MAG TPA: CapA family protein [Methylocella sp.]|nr:CapA family protein [Methylocella sp.]